MAEAAQITAFRHLIDQEVTEFIHASSQLCDPLITLASKVKRAFDLELDFIITGLNCACPDENGFTAMIEPLSEVIIEIQEFKNRHRDVIEFFNHFSTVSESIVALSWISVKPAPVQFIRDMRDAGEYFGNRVLSQYRGEANHQTWVNKWNDVLKGLEQYVKDYHLTGFDWGALLRASGVARPPGGPAPPPPPPPPNAFDPRAGGDNRNALLYQINQGVDIVRMLRPVRREPDDQTAKVSESNPDSAPVPAQHPQAQRTFPPKFFLDGRKWRIEHQRDNYALTINNDDMSQSLAMFKCQNVGVEIKNKMNGVSVDNCKRSTVVLNGIISSVELIRCENVKIQCNGHVPLISLDNCDSIQVFLTDQSIDAEIISSKSTSLNVCLLAPDGDYTELAVPEQIKTVVRDRRLVSTVVEKM